MRTPVRIFTVLIILILPVSSVFAFDVLGLQPLPPYGVFSTFSAESLKQNDVGIGLGFEKATNPVFYRTVAQLAYGLHDRFEIDVTLPFDFNWEHSSSGLEDAYFGIKHRILDEGRYNPAVAYILTVATPSGNADFSTHGQHGLGLLFTKKIGPFNGHLNVVYDKPNRSDLKEEYNFNLGAELAVTHDSNVLAEVITSKDFFKNSIDLLEWRLGYRIATLENLYTTLGVGFDVRKPTPDYRLLFSVSFILPKEKKKPEKIFEE